MDLSPIGRATLAAREGNVLTAYKDSVGVLTIGVGITTASGLITVTPGLKITPAQSDALFAQAVEKYVAPVRKALTRPVDQNAFDALVSLCYNIGPGALAGSTVIKRVNLGDLQGAADAFLMWNKPAAILSRRRAERLQFLTPYTKGAPKARDSDARPVGAPVAVPPPPDIPAPKPVAVAYKPNAGLWAWIKSKVA